MERMGQRRGQYALPAVRAGRPRGRGRAEAAAEMGVRVSGRARGADAAGRGRRAGVHGQRGAATSSRSTRSTGCTHWMYRARAAVRTAMTVAPYARRCGATRYAAVLRRRPRQRLRRRRRHRPLSSGRAQIDEHPNASITGAPAVHDGRVYRADVRGRRRGPRRTARLRLLHVQGQRLGARRRDRRRRSGSPTAFPTRRGRAATNSERRASSSARPAPASGVRRRSTRGAASCTSAPATASPTRRSRRSERDPRASTCATGASAG